MSPLDVLGARFSDHVTTRGRTYFRRGAVRIVDSSKGFVRALVQGTRRYNVEINWSAGSDPHYSCTCPYFEDNGECKHVWATVLKCVDAGLMPGTIMRYGEQPLAMGSFVEERTRGGGNGQAKDESAAWKRQLNALRDQMRAQPGDVVLQSWPANRRIVYIIDVVSTINGSGLTIELGQETIKRSGAPERPKQLKLTREEIANLPDEVDRQIMHMLLGAHQDLDSPVMYGAPPARKYVLPESAYPTTFKMMCETGRCRLRLRPDEQIPKPIQWDDGPPWEFFLVVKTSPGGKFYVLDGSLRRGGLHIPIREAHMLVRGGLAFYGNHVARLESFGAFDLVIALRQGMKLSVPIDQQQELARMLFSMPRLPKLDLPESFGLEETRTAPKPRLTVRKASRGARSDDRLLGLVEFEYGGQRISAAAEPVAIVSAEGSKVFYRDIGAESAAIARLMELGFRRDVDLTSGARPFFLPAAKLPKVVAALTTEGWIVEAEGKLYRQAGEIQVRVKSGIDWFELEGGIAFGDQTASLPQLLAAVRRGENAVLLDDGTFGLLPEEWLQKYAALAQIGEAVGDQLHFTRRQIGFLDALLSTMPQASCDETFQRARDELIKFEGIEPINEPAGFNGELRLYQRDGLGWMSFLRRFGFGGCLADDMGLGKTVQVLALLEERRQLRASSATGDEKPDGPSLVVVPRSLVFNWQQEAARFTPALRLLDHTGILREKATDHFEDYDVILTTYGTLRRDAGNFKDVNFDYVILDEAQAIKNAASESAKASKLLQGRHRLALSGTPVQNHLGELWSLFEFLNPGMMGAAAIFKATGAGANMDAEARTVMARALRPFILRRTKEQVAQDLPPKVEQTVYCDLEPVQRKLYDELRHHYRATLLDRIARDGINKAKIQILEALLRLRQAACHPGLIDKTRQGEPSAKLDALLMHIEEVLDEGHKILVFSQFTSMLAIVRQRLDAAGTIYEYLDGKTRDRQQRVERFQTDPDCKLFLISLKAGGLGLNLTAADYVFLLDPWWNPAVETQAIDRTHRIGQTRHVFAYRLIARDTDEEKVLQLQQSKRDLAEAIITADNSLISRLGREELELLLS